MSQLIKYPSTPQFRDVIRRVRDSATYHNVPVPSVTFVGSVKLHGTHADVCYKPSTGALWAQSRENVLSPVSDNAGFAMWVHGKRDMFLGMMKQIAAADHVLAEDDVIQLAGEWCGGSIQKGVGLTGLPKVFVAYGIRISPDAESQAWWKPFEFSTAIVKYTNATDFFDIYDFPTWVVTIDMAQPELMQNRLIEITEEVEKRCPVAWRLAGQPEEGEFIGEGVCYVAVSCSDPVINIEGLRFKVKGVKHSVSKVKTLAAVDPEKVANINEFAVNVCTTNRLEQGIDVLKQRGVDTTSMTNIGEYIKWVMSDIMKEELDTIAANNLSTRDVTGACINKIKEFYRNQDADN